MPPASRGLLRVQRSLVTRTGPLRGTSPTSLRCFAVKAVRVPPRPPPSGTPFVPPHLQRPVAPSGKPEPNPTPEPPPAPATEPPPEAEAEGPEELPRRPWDRIPPRVRAYLYWTLMLLPPMWLLLLHVPLEPMPVTGGSMAPFLNTNGDAVAKAIARGEAPIGKENNDWVLVSKVGFGRSGVRRQEIQRGMVVVFWAPHASPELGGRLAVKRVIAVAGDRVVPLPGWTGSAEESREGVTVPYGHVWVEGDANDRTKSVDSNWYGPISANLIVGVAQAVFQGGWPCTVQWAEHPYPAKRSGRVKMDVVREAGIHPDKLDVEAGFRDGRAELSLKQMQARSEELKAMLGDPRKAKKLRGMYQDAVRELQRGNPETLEIAAGLVAELEKVFLDAGLTRDGRSPREAVAPALRKEAQGKDEDTLEGETEGERRLRRYMERVKQQEEKAARS